MIIFKDSESLGFLSFFFYVILKLSIVRREKRMKKSKNLKGKIGAVMLSLVLALTMVVTPSMFTTKSVSADEENTENVKSQKIFDNWTMAAQIADKTTNYFDADGTPDLQTAVFYTELQYGIKPNTNEEIKAEDFCKKVKDNFTGIKSFTEADLAKINPLGMYTYDQENHKIIIPGGGAGSGLICTFIGQNEVNFGNVKYGKWKDLAVPSEEPYYIALDVKDNGQIKAYREIKSEDVSVDVDIYRYQYSDDEEEPVKVSYLKDYNKGKKAFLPNDDHYNLSLYINIKDGEENHIFNEDNFGDQSLKVRIESQNKDILTINEDEDGDFRILTDGIGTSDLKYKVQTESVSDDDNTIFEGTIPCNVYDLSIDAGTDGGLCLLPNESRQLSAKINGIDENEVTYKWKTTQGTLENADQQTCKIIAPSTTLSSEANNVVSVKAYINNGQDELDTAEEYFIVQDCNLSVIHELMTDRGYVVQTGDTLKAGQAYRIRLNGALPGFGIGNTDHTFYILKFEQDGDSVVLDENKEDLVDNNFATISVGVFGGEPNRMITPKKAGKLTVTGTIYRENKEFKTETKTFTVESDNTPSESTKPDPTPNPSNPTPSQPTTAAPATTTPAKVTVKKTTLKSAKNAKGKKLVVKWKKNTAGNGYQIQYSTSKKFAKGNKTKTISKNKTTSYTIKKLKKKKTYYVRIRTYKKVSGKTYYSGWSSVKKVKIKK